MTHNDYAPPHAATTYQMWPHHWQHPLVEPDVRFSRIRLSDDLSPQGIHKELTARSCKETSLSLPTV